MTRNRNKPRKQTFVFGSDELTQKLQERIDELSVSEHDKQPANIKNVASIKEVLARI